MAKFEIFDNHNGQFKINFHRGFIFQVAKVDNRLYRINFYDDDDNNSKIGFAVVKPYSKENVQHYIRPKRTIYH